MSLRLFAVISKAEIECIKSESQQWDILLIPDHAFFSAYTVWD